MPGCNSACDTSSVASASCALDACQLSTEYSAFGQTFRTHLDVGSGDEPGIEGTRMHLTLFPDGRLDATISVRRVDQSGNADAGAQELVLSGKTSIICGYARSTVTFHVASGSPVEVPCREEPWPECNDVGALCV